VARQKDGNPPLALLGETSEAHEEEDDEDAEEVTSVDSEITMCGDGMVGVNRLPLRISPTNETLTTIRR